MADIKYTQYSTSNPTQHPEIGEDILEETNQSLANPLLDTIQLTHPLTVTDIDGDGFREVRKSELLTAIKSSGLSGQKIPFATFFDERYAARDGSLAVYDAPQALAESVDVHDFESAREFFTDISGAADNPLAEVSEPLAWHLAATAKHAGVNVSDSVLLNSKSGFSVAGDGRLRFDCFLFAQLGESDLRGIPGLKFEYVELSNDGHENFVGMMPGNISQSQMPHPRLDYPGKGDRDSEGRKAGLKSFDFDKSQRRNNVDNGKHVILLVSDGDGNNLIVDNSSVNYFGSNDPMQEIRKRYGARYSSIRTIDPFGETE